MLKLAVSPSVSISLNFGPMKNAKVGWQGVATVRGPDRAAAAGAEGMESDRPEPENDDEAATGVLGAGPGGCRGATPCGSK